MYNKMCRHLCERGKVKIKQKVLSTNCSVIVIIIIIWVHWRICIYRRKYRERFDICTQKYKTKYSFVSL